MKHISIIFFMAIMSLQHVQAQTPSYMEFPQYGFKQKFPSTAVQHYSPVVITTVPLEKGYKYFRESGNSGVDAVLEVYKSDCIDPDKFFSNTETYLRSVNGSTSFFTDVKTEKYYEPFGWLVFKGTARKFDTDNYYLFFNAYLSTDYFIVVKVFMKNDGYWDIGYNINADKSDGNAFEPIPLSRNLTDLGIKINAQGFFKMIPSRNVAGYEFYRCSETPHLYPYFKIFALEGEVQKQYTAHINELTQNNNQLMDVKTGSIGWEGEGKTKFSNSEKKYFKFMQHFEDGSSYPIYEIYYTFDYSGKKYLVNCNVVLKDDPYLRGYYTTNFKNEVWGREIMQYYERRLLRILETIQKL